MAVERVRRWENIVATGGRGENFGKGGGAVPCICGFFPGRGGRQGYMVVAKRLSGFPRRARGVLHGMSSKLFSGSRS